VSGVGLPGAATGADLGGSSKYSSETLEDQSWRRVPCEQQLNMGQSALRGAAKAVVRPVS
jgi:hypothetical protein